MIGLKPLFIRGTKAVFREERIVIVHPRLVLSIRITAPGIVVTNRPLESLYCTG